MSGGDRLRAVRPLGNGDFRALFSAVVLSVFAAGMWAVVMVYAVMAADGGPVALSIVATANALGLIICVVPGGICADRYSRRVIVRLVEAMNVLATGSIVVAGTFGGVSIVHLAVVAFLLGAGGGFFFPAYSAMLPRILPDAQLLAANGLEGAVRPALQQAAGPAFAGVLLAALIPAHAAGVVAACHALAFVLLLLQRPEPADDPSGDAPSDAGVLRQLAEAAAFTVRTPWLLWTLLFACGWVLVSLGPQEVLLPFIAKDRVGEDPALFGFLLAAMGVGGIVGAAIVSSRPLPRRYLTAMNGVWAVSTLPFIAIGLTDQYWLMMVSMFLCGVMFSYGQVIWGTLLQRRVPRHLLGRISSLDFFVSLALMPVSMALAGPLSLVVPIPIIFIGAGVLPLIFGIVAIIAARMRSDEIAHPLTDG